jgi:hypothetical protein
MVNRSEEATNGQLEVRRAHAVVKQQLRREYATPALVLLPPDRDSTGTQSVTLQHARIAQQLSPQALADRSKISLSTIYRIEYGKTKPKPFVVHAISSALGMSPLEIVEFRDRIALDPRLLQKRPGGRVAGS